MSAFGMSRNPRSSARQRRNANKLVKLFDDSIVEGGGLEIVGGEMQLDLKDVDPGLEIVTGATGGLGVKLNVTNPGLDLVSGLAIKLDSAPALALGAGGLGVSLDATEPGLQKTTGLKVLVAPSGGLKLSSGAKVRGMATETSDPSGLSGDQWYNSTDRVFRKVQGGVVLAVPGVLGSQGGISDPSNVTQTLIGTAMPTNNGFFNSIGRILRFTIRGGLKAGGFGRTYQLYINYANGGAWSTNDVLWTSNRINASTGTQVFTMAGEIRVDGIGTAGTVDGAGYLNHFKTNTTIRAALANTYDWSALSQGISMYGIWTGGTSGTQSMDIYSALFEIIN